VPRLDHSPRQHQERRAGSGARGVRAHRLVRFGCRGGGPDALRHDGQRSLRCGRRGLPL
ncbi:MAG: hypothetical protein AVDCRST_MAG53-2108, partial [uncultured Solirubrobacteraceae bacterium]